MIISTCSFGSTGSSVITDYLKEFNTFHVMDGAELTWISAPDGIIDLDYHLSNPHCRTADSIMAIERYKTLCEQKINIFEVVCGIPRSVFEKSLNEFLDAIVMASWKWNVRSLKQEPFWRRQLIRFLQKTKCLRKWETKHKCQWEGFPYKDVFFSVKPKNFDVAVKKHIQDILYAFGAKDNEHLVFDQLFPGNNPQVCFKYFDDPYAVVVDRDPRDIYVFGKTVLLKGIAGHMMPLNDVKDFVVYYRALRDNQPYKEINDRILFLRFEDLVYHYDLATKRLRDFLHLGENPNPKSIFDPSMSMANTQIWKRYPEFNKDIEYIERELKDYLFDFTGCPEPDVNAKMFCGTSPKNKKNKIAIK